MREIPTEQVSQTMDFEQNETLIFNNFTLDELSPTYESNYNDLGIYPIPHCDRCNVTVVEAPDANKTSDPGIITIAHLPTASNSNKMPLFQSRHPVKPLSNESSDLGLRNFFPLPNIRVPQALPIDGFTDSQMPEISSQKPAITDNGNGGDHLQGSKRRKKTTTVTTRKRLRKRKTTTSTITSTTSKKKVKRTTIAAKLVI